MRLVEWKPIKSLFPWSNRIDRFFDEDFLSDWFKNDWVDSSWSPTTDILEKKDEYVFKVELPGIKKEAIKIDINDGILTIKGERKDEKAATETIRGSSLRSVGGNLSCFSCPFPLLSSRIIHSQISNHPFCAFSCLLVAISHFLLPSLSEKTIGSGMGMPVP